MNHNISDKYFPAYHFRPQKNWMNDPNGLIWYNNKYHMFYQYNPGADIWGDIHWGHAESEDLIHWTEKQVAMDPSYEEGEIHCYSGCCTEKQGQVYAFYTSIGQGVRGPEIGAQQWSARARDEELSRFDKYQKPALQQQINLPHRVTMWRDPFVWKEEDTWFMLLSGTMDQKGTILLYSSKDLDNWHKESVFFQTDAYTLIECPNILKFGEKYVLLYSPLEAIRFAVGTIDPRTKTFIVKEEGIFDYSVGKKGFYASNEYINLPDHRYIAFGCLFEGDRLNSSMKRGWAGMQSLPRHVTLDNDKLHILPAEECLTLRKEILDCLPSEGKISCDQAENRSEELNSIETSVLQAQSTSCEISLKLHPQTGEKLTVQMFASADQTEKTLLQIDYQSFQMTLDRSQSTLFEDVSTETITAPLPEDDMEAALRIFIDHSAIEIFYDVAAHNSVTISARVFPLKEDSIETGVYVSDRRMLAEGSIYALEV